MDAGSFIPVPLTYTHLMSGWKQGSHFTAHRLLAWTSWVCIYILQSVEGRGRWEKQTTWPAIGIAQLHNAEKPCRPLPVHHSACRQAFPISEYNWPVLLHTFYTHLSFPPHLWCIPAKPSFSPDNTFGALSPHPNLRLFLSPLHTQNSIRFSHH